jgi:hypothetical protein
MIFTRGILLLTLACASLSLASAKINLRDADIKVFISDMAGVTNKTFVGKWDKRKELVTIKGITTTYLLK